MASSKLRVGILGCGSAGPAAALYLARAGHDVEIFERAPSLEPVGTGFLLQPTGLEVLAELGLREAAEQFGARVDRLYSRTRRGATLLDLAYSGLGSDACGLGMHRATLLHILMQAVEQADVRIHLGCEVDASPIAGRQRFLRAGSERYGPFDLVVVANGAQSSAREWSGARISARRYPWGALWTLAPDREGRFAGELSQVVEGAGTMLGFLPSGARYDDPERTPLVSLFWSVHAEHEAAVRQRGLAALHDSIRSLEPAADAVLGGVGSMQSWAWAGYWDVVMDRLDGPAVVVLGDAGHAMSPQLGQGVNLALWDARALCHAIARTESIEDALPAFSRARRRHLAFYQRATRWLTPFFQSSVPGAGPLRDSLLPLAGRIPFVERQMLASMAGIKDGLLSRLDWPTSGASPAELERSS